MNQVINYAHLARAVEWYEANGYEHIDVDWMVPHTVALATHNDNRGQFVTLDRNDNERVLVGSAEQGFLNAVVEGRIVPDRKYMSVSPCFRRGDIGPMNQEWFIKLELSAITLDYTDIFGVMLDEAFDLFQELGVPRHKLGLYDDFEHSKNIDIVYRKAQDQFIELGSYGYRYIEGLTPYNFLLHYGTGLALPRFQLTQQ